MHTVYISIGSNLGNKQANVRQAIELCQIEFGTCCCSFFYESESWGYESENTYLNGALSFRSGLLPAEIWKRIESIETSLGRVRSGTGYEDRPIDLDIVLIGNLVLDDQLVIPHPRMHLRDFVLQPLIDLGDPLHPVFKKNASTLLEEIGNSSILKPVNI